MTVDTFNLLMQMFYVQLMAIRLQRMGQLQQRLLEVVFQLLTFK